MSEPKVQGLVYRCSVCGAELVVLGTAMGEFRPRCCDRDMVRLARHARLYVCPVCGAEIAVIRTGTGVFVPRCCNTAMRLKAA